MGNRFKYQTRKHPAWQSDEMKKEALGSVQTEEETAVLKLLDEYLKKKKKESIGLAEVQTGVRRRVC
jgi:hypothetical protein